MLAAIGASYIIDVLDTERGRMPHSGRSRGLIIAAPRSRPLLVHV
jgi:hypothetical protein